MKRLLSALFFLTPFLLDAQLSVIAEYTLDPFKSVSSNVNQVFSEEQSVIKASEPNANNKIQTL